MSTDTIYSRPGLTVNVTAIASGMWSLLPDDAKAPFVIGMAPADYMAATERQLRELLHDRAGTSDESALDVIGHPEGLMLCNRDTIVREIMHEIYLGLLSCAKEDGILQV